MMITGRNGMRFDTEKIRKEEKSKMPKEYLFFGVAILNMGLMIGYMVCAIGGVLGNHGKHGSITENICYVSPVGENGGVR